MLRDSEVSATIAVRDLAAAQTFYGETLGLKKVSENPGGVLYKSGSSSLFVYPSQYAGTNQATCASWRVDDVEGVVEALKAKGVTFEQYDNIPGITRQGDIHLADGMKSAWFKDPDGNILNIVNQIG